MYGTMQTTWTLLSTASRDCLTENRAARLKNVIYMYQTVHCAAQFDLNNVSCLENVYHNT
jgi:hypothetical protein